MEEGKIDEATKTKHYLEERQRERRKDMEKRGVKHEPVYFHK